MTNAGTVRRMVASRKILSMRHGAAAAILPKNVTLIHMDFAKFFNHGHMGPRKFWRDYLPQLKYHNPGVAMIINRTEDQLGPATMSVYFRKEGAATADTTPQPTHDNKPPTSKRPARPEVRIASSMANLSQAPPPKPDERVAKIDMKNRPSDQILELLLEETGAELVKHTAEEMDELASIQVKDRGLEAARKQGKKLAELAAKDVSLVAKAKLMSARKA